MDFLCRANQWLVLQAIQQLLGRRGKRDIQECAGIIKIHEKKMRVRTVIDSIHQGFDNRKRLNSIPFPSLFPLSFFAMAMQRPRLAPRAYLSVTPQMSACWLQVQPGRRSGRQDTRPRPCMGYAVRCCQRHSQTKSQATFLNFRNY
jgi:hypothetical protein